MVFAFFTTVIEPDRPAKKYPYRLSLFYSRIDGIKEGTEVRILGIQKGYVAHIDSRPLIDVPDRRFLDHNMDHAIELHIALEDPLTLWDNYEVDFQTITLFSGRIININPGSSDGKRPFFKPTFREGEKHLIICLRLGILMIFLRQPQSLWKKIDRTSGKSHWIFVLSPIN